MGMQTNDKRYTGALADINVTPLVDVILVLLIIFMIAAPVVLQGLATDLPRAIISDLEIESDQVVVTITSGRLLYINNDPVSRQQFVDALQNQLATMGKNSVYLRADKNLIYGDVVSVIEMIKESGVPHMGIITEQGESDEQ